MAFSRGLGQSDATSATPVARRTVVHEERRIARVSHLGTGTLACPYCAHAGPLRAFLSLAAPSRPARVEVRVVRSSR